jgi:hypothetical protein
MLDFPVRNQVRKCAGLNRHHQVETFREMLTNAS